MKRLLAVGRTYDLSDAQYDGFVLRRRLMLNALSQAFHIEIQPLRLPDDRTEINSGLNGTPLPQIDIDAFSPSKRGRLQNLVRGRATGPTQAWEEDLAETVDRLQPDVAVTFGPWLDLEYRSVFRSVPTLHVFEEDVTRMVEIAPQSRRANALRRAELYVRSRTEPVPAAVTVISQTEIVAARQRFGPTCAIHVIPQTLLPVDWPTAPGPSEGDYLFCVGALNQTRQAEGLAAFLDELRAARRPDVRVLLLSGGGLHPTVADRVATMPQVEIAPQSADVYETYRRARLALVPSMRATGMKATILQGWTTGCPIVTFDASARTLGHPQAVVSSSSPRALVMATLSLWEDEPRRRALAYEGLEVAREHFEHERWFGELVRVAAGLVKMR